MVIFHSYVSLPEGIAWAFRISPAFLEICESKKGKIWQMSEPSIEIHATSPVFLLMFCRSEYHDTTWVP